MKYTLLKKWHPNQIEEVGHVFEFDNELFFTQYFIKTISDGRLPCNVYPHEISLLCDAGYLEKMKKCIHGIAKNNVLGCTRCCEKGQKGMLLGNVTGTKVNHAEEIQKQKYIEQHNSKLCKIKGCGTFDKTVHELLKPSLDLWTTEPQEEQLYWYVTDYGDVNYELWMSSNWDGHKFRFKFKNCHKTRQSAEEALKRLNEE